MCRKRILVVFGKAGDTAPYPHYFCRAGDSAGSVSGRGEPDKRLGKEPLIRIGTGVKQPDAARVAQDDRAQLQ